MKIGEPAITVTTNEPATLGSKFEATCIVSLGTLRPNIQWLTSNSTPVNTTTLTFANTSILVFERLSTDDVGEYKCTATLEGFVSGSTYTTISTESMNLNYINISMLGKTASYFFYFFSVPIPQVLISVYPENVGVLIEGTSVELICEASLRSNLLESFDSAIHWFINGVLVTNSTEHIVGSISMEMNIYSSILQIDNLDQDGDLFSCFVEFSSFRNAALVNSSVGEDEFILTFGSEFITSKVV